MSCLLQFTGALRWILIACIVPSVAQLYLRPPRFGGPHLGLLGKPTAMPSLAHSLLMFLPNDEQRHNC
jgi:hypothetical protein